MRLNTMFITAVCVIFLIKLRWPKNKSFHALCCLLSVKKQQHDSIFLFIECIIKQLLLDSDLVISRKINVQEKGEVDNPYLDLDYSGYFKNLIP